MRAVRPLPDAVAFCKKRSSDTYVFSKINPNEFNYYDATGQTIEG